MFIKKQKKRRKAQNKQTVPREELENAINALYATADVYIPWADEPHQIRPNKTTKTENIKNYTT